MVNNRVAGKHMIPGKRISSGTRISKREALILLVIVGVAALALFTGVANAAMQSIQLNSSASFPVDI